MCLGLLHIILITSGLIAWISDIFHSKRKWFFHTKNEASNVSNTQQHHGKLAFWPMFWVLKIWRNSNYLAWVSIPKKYFYYVVSWEKMLLPFVLKLKVTFPATAPISSPCHSQARTQINTIAWVVSGNQSCEWLSETFKLKEAPNKNQGWGLQRVEAYKQKHFDFVISSALTKENVLIDAFQNMTSRLLFVSSGLFWDFTKHVTVCVNVCSAILN